LTIVNLSVLRKSYFDIITNANLAFAHLLQGRLNEAFALCQRSLGLAGKSILSSSRTPVLAYAYCSMGIIQLEWNNVEAALSYARESVALAQQWKQADALHFTLHNLSKALCAAYDLDEAFIVNHRAMQLAEKVSPWYFQLSICNEIMLELEKGDISAATRIFSENEKYASERTKDTFLFTKAFLLSAQGRIPELMIVLDEAIENTEQLDENWFLMKLLPLQALTLQILGREEEALEVIRRCLVFAAPEGYVRIFVERGRPMVKLLKAALSQGIETEYINRLLAAFQSLSEPRETPSLATKLLVEPISEREVEVLRLLEGSLNTPEIAAQLYISVGTVRTHIKNIYRKLDVNRRMEAVQRAKELGLI
jgi:LuxR family maltose regulon positive regulatory protein